jgi:hypothetical protein
MWTCVLLIETDRASLALRRYGGGSCPLMPGRSSYHNARTLIGEAPVTVSERGTWDVEMEQPPRTDPRWPAHCACGYVFLEADTWQLATHRLYMRQDTGVTLTLREAEPGMLWDAPWLLAMPNYRGPDGRSLVMRLPDGGEWTIDGPSTNGPGWERTGTPPQITARPSILSPGYHGWLTDGVLSADLEGRTY